MDLLHRIGRSIRLSDPTRDRTLWEYVYAGAPKPYLHPVCTPAGHCLTNFEPHDHVWHRGLWFTIKYVNRENFWEENKPFGTQRTAAPPTVEHEPGGRIRLTSELDWVRPDGESVVIRERRGLAYQPIDDRAYALDFETGLTARADLLLDRTPYKNWGGYGGLIFRGTRNWEDDQILFPDGSTTKRPVGVPAMWCATSGKLDGGYKRTGGFAIFDHPTNPRHPTPWYGSTGSYKFLNAAFLFHEPMQLPIGQSLTFRYRVLIHDEKLGVEPLQAAYRAYVATTSRPAADPGG